MRKIEIIQLIYKEDLKRFVNKWRKLFREIGYGDISVAISNAQVGLERELESIG